MTSETKMNSLPAKYSKYATFAYWFLEYLKTSRMIQEDSYTAICEFIHLTNGEIATQCDFYERFLTDYDSVSKVFKALNKKSKGNKNRKPAEEKKPKKNKNNTNSKFNPNLDIISQIVLRANSMEDLDSDATQVNIVMNEAAPTTTEDLPLSNEKKPKEKGEKKAKEPKEKKAKEPKEKKAKEPKEKKAKESKEKKEVETAAAAVDADARTTTDDVSSDPFGLNQISTPIDEIKEDPVVQVRINTPVLPVVKEKKVKEPKEPKEKKAKEPKEKKAKEPKEPKEKKAKEPKEPKEKKAKEPKEPKEKKAKEPKDKKETMNVQTTIANEDTTEEKNEYESKTESPRVIHENYDDNEADEEDVDLYVVMIDGVEHYYDDAKNLYDGEQNIIGTFDSSTKEIHYFNEK